MLGCVGSRNRMFCEACWQTCEYLGLYVQSKLVEGSSYGIWRVLKRTPSTFNLFWQDYRVILRREYDPASPPSLLKWLPSADVRICSASFRRISPCLLAQCSIAVPLQLIGWFCSHACSATADFSTWCLLQAFLCSFSLISKCQMVFPMYTWLHKHGVRYTTMDCFPTGSWSFTLISKEWRVLPALNATFTSCLLQTLLISLLTPAR